MSNKSYKAIVILISVALLCVIALQGLWLNNLLKIKTEELNSKTKEALAETVNRIQKNEDLAGVREHIEELIPDSVLSKNIQLFISDKGNHAHTYTSIDNIDSSFMYEDSILVKEMKQNNVSTKTETVVRVLPSGKKTIVVTSETENKLGKKIKNITSIVKKMAVESAGKHRLLLSRFNFDSINGLLKNELAKKGIEQGFEYAVQSAPPRDSVLKKSPNFTFSGANKQYGEKMFPDDIIPENNTLLLYYPNENYYAFSQMKGILGMSVLFTLIIITAFFLTVKTILKQKRVTEIKNDFINNMTHEFKTPLATISIAVDAVNNPKVRYDDEKFNYYSAIIKEENNKMNSHVEKVLQMALIDKGNIHLSLSNIDIHALIEQAIDNHKLLIKNKNAEILVGFDAKHSIIRVDEFHLLNVLNNLIDNALKYSNEQARINIQTANEGNLLVIVVKDNGIGMGKEILKNVFEKFYRAQTGNVHDVKGFGLGLSYVKNIVEAHAGEIAVQSQTGTGSVFTIQLPLNEK